MANKLLDSARKYKGRSVREIIGRDALQLALKRSGGKMRKIKD